jgi:hypothetical protein
LDAAQPLHELIMVADNPVIQLRGKTAKIGIASVALVAG